MTTQNTQVQKAQQSQQSPIIAFTKALNGEYMSKYLADTLGAKKAEFVANITALVSNSTSLQECTPHSIVFSALKATALDLPLDQNLGMAYVIPFNNKKKGIKEAQFQIGYKGFVQLSIRSGQFKTINVRDVREGEYLGENFVSGEMLFKQVADRTNKPIVGYLAYFKLINGFEKMLYITKEDAEVFAITYSKTYGSSEKWAKEQSLWTTSFDAMAKKTILKSLLKGYAPLSVAMQSAIKADQAVIDEHGERYVDNEPKQIEVSQEQQSKAVDMFAKAFDNGQAEDVEIVDENKE